MSSSHFKWARVISNEHWSFPLLKIVTRVMTHFNSEIVQSNNITCFICSGVTLSCPFIAAWPLRLAWPLGAPFVAAWPLREACPFTVVLSSVECPFVAVLLDASPPADSASEEVSDLLRLESVGEAPSSGLLPSAGAFASSSGFLCRGRNSNGGEISGGELIMALKPLQTKQILWGVCHNTLWPKDWRKLIYYGLGIFWLIWNSFSTAHNF